jgi:hypothetical protein
MGEELVGKIVRHFKGKLYLVLAVGRDSEEGDWIVAYKALYGTGDVWFRDYFMFTSLVPEGKENPTNQAYRFEVYNGIIEREI